MAKPVFKQLSEDDLLWTYDATLTEYMACKSNPTAWFNSNIKGLDDKKSCDNPGGNNFIDSRRESDNRIKLYGLCGTPTIIGNGYHKLLLGVYNALHQHNLELTAKKLPIITDLQFFIENVLPSIASRRPLSAFSTPEDFWKDFDQKLVMYGKAGAEIIVTVDAVSNTGSVHLDLGHQSLLYFALHGAVSVDPKAYARWLTTPPNPIITRTAFFTDAAGNSTRMPLNSASVINAETLITDPIFVPNSCPAPDFCYSACNVDTGDVTSYNAANGIVNMDLEVIIVKPYCIPNPTGAPCP